MKEKYFTLVKLIISSLLLLKKILFGLASARGIKANPKIKAAFYHDLGRSEKIQLERRLYLLFSKTGVLSEFFYAMMKFDRRKILAALIKSQKIRRESDLKKISDQKKLYSNGFSSVKSLKDLKSFSVNSDSLTADENRDFNFQSGIYFDPNPVGIFFVFLYGFSEFVLTIYAMYSFASIYFDFSFFQTLFGLNENFLLYHYLVSLYHVPYKFSYTFGLIILMIIITFWNWLDDILESEEEEETFKIPDTSWFIEGFLMPAFTVFTFLSILLFFALSYHNIIIIYGYFLPPLYDQLKNLMFVLSTLHQKMTNYVIVFDLKVLNDLLFLTQPKFIKVIEADPLILFNGTKTSIYYTSIKPENNPFFYTEKYFTNFPNFISKNFFQVTDFHRRNFYDHQLLKHELLQDIRKLNYLSKLEVDLSFQKNFFPTVSNHFVDPKVFFHIEPGRRTFSSTPEKSPSSLLTSIKFRNFEAVNYLFKYGVPQPTHSYKFGNFGSFKFSHYKIKTTYNIQHSMRPGVKIGSIMEVGQPFGWYSLGIMDGLFTFNKWYIYRNPNEVGWLPFIKFKFLQPDIPQDQYGLRTAKYKMPPWFKIGYKRDARVNDIKRPRIRFGTTLTIGGIDYTKYYRTRKIQTGAIRAISYEESLIFTDVANAVRQGRIFGTHPISADHKGPPPDEHDVVSMYFQNPRYNILPIQKYDITSLRKTVLNAHQSTIMDRVLRESVARYMKRIKNVEANVFKFDRRNILDKKSRKKPLSGAFIPYSDIAKKFRKRISVPYGDITDTVMNRKPLTFPHSLFNYKYYADEVWGHIGAKTKIGSREENLLYRAGHLPDTLYKRRVEAVIRTSARESIFAYIPRKYRRPRFYGERRPIFRVNLDPTYIPTPGHVQTWALSSNQSDNVGAYPLIHGRLKPHKFYLKAWVKYKEREDTGPYIMEIYPELIYQNFAQRAQIFDWLHSRLLGGMWYTPIFQLFDQLLDVDTFHPQWSTVKRINPAFYPSLKYSYLDNNYVLGHHGNTFKYKHKYRDVYKSFTVPVVKVYSDANKKPKKKIISWIDHLAVNKNPTIEKYKIIDKDYLFKWWEKKYTDRLVTREADQADALVGFQHEINLNQPVGMRNIQALELYSNFSKFFKFLLNEGYKYEHFYFRNYSRTFRFIFVDFISKNLLNEKDYYFSNLRRLKYYSNYMDEEIKISQLADFQNVLWNKYLHKYYSRTIITAGSQAKLKDLNFPIQDRFSMPKQLILMPNPIHKIVRHAQLLYRLDWKATKDLWLEYPRQQYRSNLRKLWHYRANKTRNTNRFNRFALKAMLKDAQACLVFDRRQRAYSYYLNELIAKKLVHLEQKQKHLIFDFRKSNPDIKDYSFIANRRNHFVFKKVAFFTGPRNKWPRVIYTRVMKPLSLGFYFSSYRSSLFQYHLYNTTNSFRAILYKLRNDGVNYLSDILPSNTLNILYTLDRMSSPMVENSAQNIDIYMHARPYYSKTFRNCSEMVEIRIFDKGMYPKFKRRFIVIKKYWIKDLSFFKHAPYVYNPFFFWLLELCPSSFNAAYVLDWKRVLKPYFADWRGIYKCFNAKIIRHTRFDLFSHGTPYKNFISWENFLKDKDTSWENFLKKYIPVGPKTSFLKPKKLVLGFKTPENHHNFFDSKNLYFSKKLWLDMQGATPYYYIGAHNKFEQNNSIFDHNTRQQFFKKTVVPLISREDCISIKHFLMDRSFNTSNEELSNILRRFAYRTKRPYMKSIHLASFLRTKNKLLGNSFSLVDIKEMDSASYLELDKYLLQADSKRRRIFSKVNTITRKKLFKKFKSAPGFFINKRNKKFRHKFLSDVFRGIKNRNRIMIRTDHSRYGSSRRFFNETLRRRITKVQNFKKILKIFKKTFWLIPLINYNDKFVKYSYRDVFFFFRSKKNLQKKFEPFNILEFKRFNRKGEDLVKILFAYKKQKQLKLQNQFSNFSFLGTKRNRGKKNNVSTQLFFARLWKQRMYRIYGKSRFYRRAILLNLIHRMKFGINNIVNDRIFGKEISNDRFLLKRLFNLSLGGFNRMLFNETTTFHHPFSNLTFLNLLNSRISKPNLNTEVFFEGSIINSEKTFDRGGFGFLLTSKEFKEHLRLGYKLWLPAMFKLKYPSGIIGYGSKWFADDSWVTKRFKKYGFRSFKSFRTLTSRDLFYPIFPTKMSRLKPFVYRNPTKGKNLFKRGLYTELGIERSMGLAGNFKQSYLNLKRFQFFNVFKDRASYVASRFFFNTHYDRTFLKYNYTENRVPSFHHRFQRRFGRKAGWKLPMLKLRPSPKYLILRNNQIRFNKLLAYLNFFKALSVPLNKSSSFIFWKFFLSAERRYLNLYSLRDRFNPQINFNKSFIENGVGKVLVFDKEDLQLKIIYPNYGEMDIFSYNRFRTIVRKRSSRRFSSKIFLKYYKFYFPIYYSRNLLSPIAEGLHPASYFKRYSFFKFLHSYFYFLNKNFAGNQQKNFFLFGVDNPSRNNIYKYQFFIRSFSKQGNLLAIKPTKQYNFLENYGLSSKDYFFIVSTNKAVDMRTFNGPQIIDSFNYRGFFKLHLKNLSKDFSFIEGNNRNPLFLSSDLHRTKERYKLLGRFLMFGKNRLDHTNFYTPEEYVEYKRQKRFAWKQIHKFRRIVKHYKRYYRDPRPDLNYNHKALKMKADYKYGSHLKRLYKGKVATHKSREVGHLFAFLKGKDRVLKMNKINSKYYSLVYNSKHLKYHFGNKSFKKFSFTDFLNIAFSFNFRQLKLRVRDYFIDFVNYDNMKFSKKKKNRIHRSRTVYSSTFKTLNRKRNKLFMDEGLFEKKLSKVKKNKKLRTRKALQNVSGNRKVHFYFPFKHSKWYYNNFFASYPVSYNESFTIDKNYAYYIKIRNLSYELLVRKIEFDIFMIKRNLAADILLYHYPVSNFSKLSLEDYERFIYLSSKIEFLKLKVFDSFMILKLILKKMVLLYLPGYEFISTNPFNVFFCRSLQFLVWISYTNIGYEQSLFYDFKGFRFLIEGLKSFAVFFQFLSIFSFTFFFIFFLYPFWIIIFYFTFLAKYKSGADDAGFWSKANLEARGVYTRDQILEKKNVKIRRSFRVGRIRVGLENYFNRFFYNTYRLEKLLYTTTLYYDFGQRPKDNNLNAKVIKRPAGFNISADLIKDWEEEGGLLIIYATKLYMEFIAIIFLTALTYILVS